MNQFKKAQVIMLPTENENQGIYLSPVPSINKIHYWDKRISNSYIAQHLYITSDDEIKEGDWFLTTSGNAYRCIESNSVTIYYYKGNDRCSHAMKLEGCKKLIASSDEELNKGKVKSESLPQPSQQFIEQYIESYNKGEVITNVLVEYEKATYDKWFNNGGQPVFDTLKINPKDNTITIKKLKDSWNREEVVELIENYSVFDNGTISTRDNWIKENL